VETVLSEWLSVIIRWLHVIAGIAWIGSSFYFIHLDLSLKPRADLPEGVRGEAWQVHGGGFYHMMKYVVAPAHLPDALTWFKWEAYTTWLSGFALMAIVYYLGAELFLIDKSVLDLSRSAAIAVSCGSLLAGWLAYEALCRSPLGRHEVALALVGYVFLVALAYGFTHLFSGRGAFIQIGALIGTIMVANVFVVVIPNQKKSVTALLAGQEPDNSRHEGKGSPWWTWAVAAAGMLAIAWLSGAGPRGAASSELPATPQFADVESIVISRCSMCHASQPVWLGFAAAPGGVRLDNAERIRAHARLIEIHAVRSHAMPPGNVTAMTADERRILAAWLAAGASGR
jgi:uncharacterized membrane protein